MGTCEAFEGHLDVVLSKVSALPARVSKVSSIGRNGFEDQAHTPSNPSIVVLHAQVLHLAVVFASSLKL